MPRISFSDSLLCNLDVTGKVVSMLEKNIKKFLPLIVAVMIVAALGLAASLLFSGAVSSEPNEAKTPTNSKNTAAGGKSGEILEFGSRGTKDGDKGGKSKPIKKGDTFNFGSKKYVISNVEEVDGGHTIYVKVAGEGKDLIKDSSVFAMQLTGCTADTETKASWLGAKSKQAYYVPAATPDKGSGWLLFSCNKKPAKLIFALGGQRLEFEKKK